MSQFTNQCEFCGKEEDPNNVLLPFGSSMYDGKIITKKVFWVHDLCWKPWFNYRMEQLNEPDSEVY